MNDTEAQWERFLTPEILRENLLAGSIYIVAYEILEDIIINRVKQVYNDFFEYRKTPNLKYEQEVCKPGKNPLKPSLNWLLNSKVIRAEDLTIFKRAKDLRNLLVHEFPQIENGLPDDFWETLRNLMHLIDKIERWWIVNFEIPANPDFDDIEIDYDKVSPGTLASLRILLNVALGSEKEARQYLNILNKNQGSG